MQRVTSVIDAVFKENNSVLQFHDILQTFLSLPISIKSKEYWNGTEVSSAAEIISFHQKNKVSHEWSLLKVQTYLDWDSAGTYFRTSPFSDCRISKVTIFGTIQKTQLIWQDMYLNQRNEKISSCSQQDLQMDKELENIPFQLCVTAKWEQPMHI